MQSVDQDKSRFLFPIKNEKIIKKNFEFKTENATSKAEASIIFPDFEELIETAEILMRGNDYILAKNLIGRSLQFYPKNNELLLLLGKISRHLKDWPMVVQCYKTLVQIDFTEDNVITLCDALQELGDYSEAKLKYEELLIKKNISEENLFDIYKQVGNLSIRDGDLDAAEEYYNKAFSIDSQSDVLLVNFGTLELQRGDYEKALICFREAIDINKSNAKAWIGLGMIHRKYGDHELSIANIICALDLEPENKTALRLYSDWSVQSSCIQSACEHLETYLEKNDQDVEFILIYAKLNFILGKINKAKLEAEKAFSLEPENIDTLEFINIIKKKI